MSFLSTSFRASLVLLLLAGAPRAGCAAPMPCPPVAARAALTTDSAAAVRPVRLHLGNLEVSLQPPTSVAAQTVVVLGRVVVRSLRVLTGHAVDSF